MPSPRRQHTRPRNKVRNQKGGDGLIGEGCIKNLYTPLFGDPGRIDRIKSRITKIQTSKDSAFKKVTDDLIAVFDTLQEKWDYVAKFLANPNLTLDVVNENMSKITGYLKEIDTQVNNIIGFGFSEAYKMLDMIAMKVSNNISVVYSRTAEGVEQYSIKFNEYTIQLTDNVFQKYEYLKTKIDVLKAKAKSSYDAIYTKTVDVIEQIVDGIENVKKDAADIVQETVERFVDITGDELKLMKEMFLNVQEVAANVYESGQNSANYVIAKACTAGTLMMNAISDVRYIRTMLYNTATSASSRIISRGGRKQNPKHKKHGGTGGELDQVVNPIIDEILDFNDSGWTFTQNTNMTIDELMKNTQEWYSILSYEEESQVDYNKLQSEIEGHENHASFDEVEDDDSDSDDDENNNEDNNNELQGGGILNIKVPLKKPISVIMKSVDTLLDIRHKMLRAKRKLKVGTKGIYRGLKDKLTTTMYGVGVDPLTYMTIYLQCMQDTHTTLQGSQMNICKTIKKRASASIGIYERSNATFDTLKEHKEKIPRLKGLKDDNSNLPIDIIELLNKFESYRKTLTDQNEDIADTTLRLVCSLIMNRVLYVAIRCVLTLTSEEPKPMLVEYITKYAKITQKNFKTAQPNPVIVQRMYGVSLHEISHSPKDIEYFNKLYNRDTGCVKKLVDILKQDNGVETVYSLIHGNIEEKVNKMYGPYQQWATDERVQGCDKETITMAIRDLIKLYRILNNQTFEGQMFFHVVQDVFKNSDEILKKIDTE